MGARRARSGEAAAGQPLPGGEAFGATLKYNPQFWSDDELRAIFVAHTQELATIVDALRRSVPESVAQHLLVTGPHGSGKSMLLRRVALAVRDDPGLAGDWLALVFPEEQYTVSNLGELWSRVLEALADALERQGRPSEAAQLDAAIGALEAVPAEEREDAALTLLTDWIARHRQGLLFLIDSTDLLLANLAGGNRLRTDRPRTRIGDDGATPLWRLRATLSHQRGIFWLGASKEALETQQHYHDAFHDFFHLIDLRPLSLARMRATLLALAHTFGLPGLRGEAASAALARMLEAQPERLRALRVMSGGNPRATAMLYDLLATGAAGSVRDDLQRLLDMMTPFYKARMGNLAEQPRKLLAHLMELWAPQSARELGEASAIAVTTVSGQLSRLEADGLVEKVRLPGAKRSGYQVSERLFNVWYLMRYASRRLRQPLDGLLEFMQLWFGAGGPGVGTRAVGEVAASPHAGEVDGEDPCALLRRARWLVADGQGEAAASHYRRVALLGEAGPRGDGRPEELLPLLLQSHLWLGNRDAARLLSETLARQAAAGNRQAFLGLREQVRECHQLGIGQALAGLLEEGAHADFLKPFVLALRTLAGEDVSSAAPREVAALAEEVSAALRPGTLSPA